MAFVLHDGILREAMSQDYGVVSVLGGNISGDRRGEIQGMISPLRLQ